MHGLLMYPLATVPLEKLWIRNDLLENDYPSRSVYKLHGSTLTLTLLTSPTHCAPYPGERSPIRAGKVRCARLPRRAISLSQ